MYSLLFDIFWWIVMLNLFALGVLIIFLCNARINLQRQIDNKRFLISVLNTAKNSNSSGEAAESLNITVDEYFSYCQLKGIDTPEQRKEKRDRIKKKSDEADRRIMEEEATWRAEHEKMEEERRKTIEEEARKRKERLKDFGFR